MLCGVVGGKGGVVWVCWWYWEMEMWGELLCCWLKIGCCVKWCVEMEMVGV